MIHQLLKAWPCLLFLLMLSACTRYQYATISSPLKQNVKREFVHENDSIQVVYNFNGYSGPVNITVHNKLDMPMFVNWRMSSLIVDGQSKSYYDQVSEIQGVSSGTQVNWNQSLATTNATFSGTVSHDDEVGYIPAGRHITVTPVYLKSDLFKPDLAHKPSRKTFNTFSGPSSGKNYGYDQANTPLRYQSYLTYSTDGHFASIATVEDDFWVSEILITHTKPSEIINMEERQADTFYNSKLTGFGGTMAVLGLIVLLGINGALQQ